MYLASRVPFCAGVTLARSSPVNDFGSFARIASRSTDGLDCREEPPPFDEGDLTAEARLETVAPPRCLSLASSEMGAATLCVNPGGTGGCFSSIQGAVDAASAADEISVAAGSYAGVIEIRAPASRTIRGAGAALTSVNGFVEINGGRARISDLTIVGQAVGVVLRSNSARAAIENCIIEGASAEGLSVDEGGATLIDSEIRGNGGFGVNNFGGAGQFGSGRTRIVRTTVSSNAGGGVSVANDSVSIDDSTASGNGGPGLHVGSGLKMRGSTVTGNALGVVINQDGHLTVASSILANATSGSDVLQGPRREPRPQADGSHVRAR
jgi:hypothetical protein